MTQETKHFRAYVIGNGRRVQVQDQSGSTIAGWKQPSNAWPLVELGRWEQRQQGLYSLQIFSGAPPRHADT